MSAEYVIVRDSAARYYICPGFTNDPARATIFPTVRMALQAVGSQRLHYEDGLTIHRVVREPARVEEVPLKDAVVFAVEYRINGEIFYAWKNEHQGIGGLDKAELFGSIDAAVTRATAMAWCAARRDFRIVGVREVPGKVSTVEVG